LKGVRTRSRPQPGALPRLQAERNFLRALPCRPCASAFFEHSRLVALRGFAAGAVAAGAVIAGFAAGVAGFVALVCARAKEAQRLIAAAAANFTRDVVVIETSRSAVTPP
jgi:hypothetical protein